MNVLSKIFKLLFSWQKFYFLIMRLQILLTNEKILNKSIEYILATKKFEGPLFSVTW